MRDKVLNTIACVICAIVVFLVIYFALGESFLWSVIGSLIAGVLLAVIVKLWRANLNTMFSELPVTNLLFSIGVLLLLLAVSSPFISIEYPMMVRANSVGKASSDSSDSNREQDQGAERKDAEVEVKNKEILVLLAMLGSMSLALYKLRSDKENNFNVTFPQYIQTAAQMYQNPDYVRVVTTMQKWLCKNGVEAKLLSAAFQNINGETKIYFIGHIDAAVNFPGVIWRCNEILKSGKSRERIRVFHINHDHEYPNCVIGQRKSGELYKEGDLILAFPKSATRHAHRLEYRQHRIAMLVNQYIDTLFAGYNSSRKTEEDTQVKIVVPEENSVELRDGLEKVVEVLKNYKEQYLTNHGVRVVSLEQYVSFVANVSYGRYMQLVNGVGVVEDDSHIMDKKDFPKTFVSFLEKLSDIKVVKLKPLVEFLDANVDFDIAAHLLSDKNYGE